MGAFPQTYAKHSIGSQVNGLYRAYLPAVAAAGAGFLVDFRSGAQRYVIDEARSPAIEPLSCYAYGWHCLHLHCLHRLPVHPGDCDLTRVRAAQSHLLPESDSGRVGALKASSTRRDCIQRHWVCAG